MKRFGVMLDMSRNAVMKPYQVKKFADIIKKFGYNMLQLYTEDTYEVDGEPYFGYMRGRYSIEELKDIANYCASIGVEVIPCIQTLAHLKQIFRWKEYAPILDTEDILLVDNDRTYQLIENMFQSLKKWTLSSYVHIGMDEAHMLGLGKYLDSHGYTNRFEILNNHLKKVMEIGEKYGFKLIMWSDMFIRLGNHGEYYSENIYITQEVIDITPKDVGLVFWDYYHEDKKLYDVMFSAHKKFQNEVWFAGGAWTWSGFAPNNKTSMDTMAPAMQSAKEHGIENIFITMWGDNGKECSFYAVLASLYAIRKIYDGETDTKKIKAQFKEITGEDYDSMMALDLPNFIGNNYAINNVSKYMLYSDPFLGSLDSTVSIDYAADYKDFAAKLSQYGAESKNYGYLFETLASLCNVLSVKYSLGAETRNAYQQQDKEKLKELISKYDYAITAMKDFHSKFTVLWNTENKPYGLEVHDLRMGGLIHRLGTCKNRLNDYCNGTIESIPELEETLLDWHGNKNEFSKKIPYQNAWHFSVSPNCIS